MPPLQKPSRTLLVALAHRLDAMTKKNKLKTSPEIEQEETVTEEEKKPSTKKPGSEIDEIFARIKRKKSELQKTEKDATAKPKKVKNKKKDTSKVHDNDEGGFGDSSSKLRKKSADGITINTGAGGTPFCPFDCSCCF